MNKSFSDTFGGVHYSKIFEFENLDTSGLNVRYGENFYGYYLKPNFDFKKKTYLYAYKGRNILIQKDSKNKNQICGFYKLEYLYGLIDKFENEILPPIYQSLFFDSYSNIFLYNKEEYYGCMNRRFQKIVELKNISLDHIYVKNGKVKLVLVRDYFISENDRLEVGSYLYSRNLFKYIIDTNINYVVQPDTYSVLEIVSSQLNFVNGHIFDNKMKKLNQDFFDDIYYCEPNLYRVTKNKKFGYVNNDGIQIIPFECSDRDDYSRKYIPVYRDTNVFYYDKQGEFVDLRAKYSDLELEKLPRYTVNENDTNFFYPVKQEYNNCDLYDLKYSAPNGYYKILSRTKSEKGENSFWREGYFIETMEHGLIKKYAYNQLNISSYYNLGVKISEKISNVKQ